MISPIVDINVVNFINSIQKKSEGELGKLQEECISLEIPIIDPETAKFLEFLLSVLKPKNILEIGTAVGFSSILMSEYIGENGHITTIDRSEIMIEKAKKNFEKFNVCDKITFLEGNANEILKNLEGTFDFIFMDAGKGQYVQILPDVLRLLKKGGVIFADDIFQNGNIIKNIDEIERRQRTIHKRMNEFLKIMTNHESLQTSIISVADGILLSFKK